MMRLAILDDYQRAALAMADWDSLRPAMEIQSFHDILVSDDAVAERLRDFEIIVAMRERTAFRRSLLERLPKLKLLVTTGMINASIDLKAAAERGIVVCGTSALRHPTAELTLGLILVLARSITREDAAMRKGGWQTTIGIGLHGKVLGILGLGRLGSQVAAFGKAFQMEVIAWSENLTAERASSLGVQRVDKQELFRTSDFLTIHLILSNRRRRSRCVRPGAAARGSSSAALGKCRADPSSRLRHGRKLSRILRRCRRECPRLPRRQSDPSPHACVIAKNLMTVSLA